MGASMHIVKENQDNHKQYPTCYLALNIKVGVLQDVGSEFLLDPTIYNPSVVAFNVMYYVRYFPVSFNANLAIFRLKYTIISSKF
jgi:hypothetical protein